MKALTKERKLEKILEWVNEFSISAYEIYKNTSISQQGIGKILSKKIKNPHQSTVDTLYNYLIKYDNSVDAVNETAELYDISTKEKQLLKTTYQALLNDVNALLDKLEKAPADIVTLQQRREALELKNKIQNDLNAL